MSNKKVILISVWNNRLFLLRVCGTGLLLGIVVAFSIPPEYETNIFTVPESTSFEIMGEIEELGASAGMGIAGKRMRDAILPSFYPIVISSTPFLTSLFTIPVTPVCYQESGTITLFEYMSEHQRSPWWSVVVSLPFRAIDFVANLFKEDEVLNEDRPDGKPLDIFRLSRRERAVASAINQRIDVGVDRIRRTIILTVRMQDPVVAATVADSVSARLKTFVTDYRTKKERKNLAFAESIQQQTRKEYYLAQEEYAHFADRNQDLSHKTAQAELIRLKIRMDLAYREYVKMTQQLEAAKSTLYRERPVYAVIEPAKVPLRPVAPSKPAILAGFVLLSGIIGYGWLWVRKKSGSYSIIPH